MRAEGALKFAEAHGYEREDLLTEKARTAWLVWKESLRSPSGFNNWVSMDQNLSGDATPLKQLKEAFPRADDKTLAWAWEMANHPTYGTINCLALNENGEMSGVTTTSGLAWKIPGRVGDSPIIGAGLYVDQDVGGAGSTGVGEENIRIAGGHTVVECMRRGMSPKEAVTKPSSEFQEITTTTGPSWTNSTSSFMRFAKTVSMRPGHFGAAIKAIRFTP